jgi:flagellar basal body-associated protein FliL
MKNIISAIVVVICIVVGGIGGNFLKTGSGASSEKPKHAEKSEDKSHGAEPAHEKKEKGGHGSESASKDSHGNVSSSGVEYFKFTREFVVPIMRESKVDSLVILNINLEVDASLAPKLFAMEPKVRDNIMTTLVELSNDGSTLEAIANLENYESIRASVLKNLKVILPDGIRNVLIVDMAKQDL